MQLIIFFSSASTQLTEIVMGKTGPNLIQKRYQLLRGRRLDRTCQTNQSLKEHRTVTVRSLAFVVGDLEFDWLNSSHDFLELALVSGLQDVEVLELDVPS